MVEILKRGTLPEDETREVTCGHCRSVLRFKRSEGRQSRDQRDGGALTFTCPVCEHAIWVAAHPPPSGGGGGRYPD